MLTGVGHRDQVALRVRPGTQHLPKLLLTTLESIHPNILLVSDPQPHPLGSPPPPDININTHKLKLHSSFFYLSFFFFFYHSSLCL